MAKTWLRMKDVPYSELDCPDINHGPNSKAIWERVRGKLVEVYAGVVEPVPTQLCSGPSFRLTEESANKAYGYSMFGVMVLVCPHMAEID